MIARATARPKLSLRYGAVHARAMAEQMPAAAMIPAPELRRLVATMVD